MCREIGVRLALGGMPADVVRLMLREAALPGVVGVAIGAALSLALGRVVSSQLYGVQATDPRFLLAASATIVAAVLTAAWVPARRAARVDAAAELMRE